MVQKGLSYEAEEEWHNIKQSIAKVNEEMSGEKGGKNREMKNSMTTNVGEL
jgi:hypothetical protein